MGRSTEGGARRARPGARAGAIATAIGLAAQLVLAGAVAALAPQTITFSLPAFAMVGDTVPLSATASSGLPVSYESLDEAQCTVDGTMLSLLAQGECAVVASQAGDATYAPADPVLRSMQAKLPQAITFVFPATGSVGGTVLLGATATSGLEIAYDTSTPVICTIAGTTVTLVAQGTCTVRASQPGSDIWTPAASVQRSMDVGLPPWMTADGAFLGRFAFNGAVRAMTIDEATGTTYVGGSFTQVGVRTGAIAHVDPPGSGSDALQPSTPDVVSNQLMLFADDATGYFAVGAVGSINRDGLHRHGTIRMTGAGAVDPSWQVSDPCNTHIEPRAEFARTLVAPIELAQSGSGLSTVGLGFIDKDTGEMTYMGAGTGACAAGARAWPSIPTLPPLAACASWNVCVATNYQVIVSWTSHLLVTETAVVTQQTASSAVQSRRYLVAYDINAGSRLWTLELEDPQRPPGFPPTGDWGGIVKTMAIIGGSIVLSGRFPLEPDPSTISTMILVNAANGNVLQRWNAAGEQDLTDPSLTIAPASTCMPALLGWSGDDATTWSYVPIDAGTAIGYASPRDTPSGHEVAVCAYSTTGSGQSAALRAVLRGTMIAERDSRQFYVLPNSLHGDHYVVGGYGAFDLQADRQAPGWNPAPSNGPASVLSLGDSIVLGGNIVFVHGLPAWHVAALDADLAPIDGFRAELRDTAPSGEGIQDVRAIGIANGEVIVVGDLKGEFGRGPVVTLDPGTGSLGWAQADADLTFGLALAVDAVSGAFYVGAWSPASDNQLRRFVPSGGGFAVDGTFDHPLGAYDGGRYVSGLALIGSRLYVGGEFSSVDGQARQGLARLTNGTLDAWDPALMDEIDADPGDIVELQPLRFLELNGRVVVAGNFNRIRGTDSTTVPFTSVVAYDPSTGARVRPTGTNVAWFPDDYWALDMVVVDQTLYVAMGASGVGAFDVADLDYLPSRSTRTQPGWGENMILALGTRAGTAPTGTSKNGLALDTGVTAAQDVLVLGGDLGHWSNSSAGNVVAVPPSDRITIARTGTGKGSVASQPLGLACGSTCSWSFPLGSQVVLSATPIPGAAFTGWSGGGCSGTGTCTVSVTSARTVTASFADKAKPTVGSVATAIRSGTTLSGTAIPLRITWVGTDTGGAGIQRYELARSLDGGATWKTLTTTLTAAAFNVTAPSSGTVRYRVRAFDKAGNAGSWVAGATLQPRLVQQTSSAVGYAKTWTTVSNASCSGGSARYATATGASATYTFTGRAAALITTKASNRGQAKIYVNGVLVATIDLRSGGTLYRAVAWQMRWPTSATRTLKIVVVGTAGRPRVDVDAFAVLQ